MRLPWYQRWRAAYVQRGLLNTVLYALRRFLTGYSRHLRLYKYYFVAQPVAASANLPAHRGRRIEIRCVPPTDSAVALFPRPPSVVQARYNQGATCLGAFQDDRFVGYAWIIADMYDEDEVRCRFCPLPAGRSAWDFDFHLQPDYRGGAAFGRLWDEVNAYLSARGIGWTLSRISAFNTASLAAHRRLGARILGSALFFSIGSWQLMFATVAPFFHLTMPQRRGPTIRLHAPDE